MRDAMRGYLQIAADMIEAAGQQAASAVRTLTDQNVTADQPVPESFRQQIRAVPEQLQKPVQRLAEDLLAAGRANRDLLIHVIRTEAEKVVARLGERVDSDLNRVQAALEKVERHIDSLEQRVDGMSARVAEATGALVAGVRDSAAKEAGSGGSDEGIQIPVPTSGGDRS